MRIVYLSSSTVPSTANAADSVHVMKMCQAMAALGHEPTLVARRGESRARDDYMLYGVTQPFPIVKTWTPQIRMVGGAWQAMASTARLWRLPRPDLYYARHLISLAAVAKRGAPLIYEVHDLPSRHHRSIERWLLRRPNFARLVSITEALQQEYLRMYPHLAPEQTIVAPDAADLPTVDQSMQPQIEQLRSTPGELQVGYIGALFPGKGMEVIAELASQVRWAHFHVVGGLPADIELWKQRTGRCENITFHGFVSPADAEPYRQAMDVLLAPYQRRVAAGGNQGDIARWMSPLKLFEYMASRKAIVASDLPVLREVLSHDVNALLASPEDLPAWVAALEQLRCERTRGRLADTAFAEFQQRFTWKRRAENVLAGLPVHQRAAA